MLPSEFRVLAYLYGRRNRKTGQCNPRKSGIAKDITMDRSNVSRAIDGLLEGGWITLSEDGNFTFHIPPATKRPTLPFAPRRGGRNVVNLTTNKSTANVVNLTTNEVETEKEDVVTVTTEVCEIRTPLLSICPQTDDAHIRNARAFLTEKEQRSNKVGEAHTAEHQPLEKTPSKKSVNRTRGSRLPEPFILTAQMRAYAAEKRPHVDVIEETEKFVNHFRGAAGAKGVKLDWLATWRNWILNSDRFGGRNGNGTHKPTSERERQAARSSNSRRFADELERQALDELAREAVLRKGG